MIKNFKKKFHIKKIYLVVFYIFSQKSNDKLTFFYTKNELHINDTYLIKSFTSYE